MPSGKTHDAITIITAIPIFGAAYWLSADGPIAIVATAAYLFGGLMFGPDLDTVSKQYSRWKILRPLWFPYRIAFKHRSRWSHGLIFGTLFRVVYFTGVVSLVAYFALLAKASVSGGDAPQLAAFTDAWRQFGVYVRGESGKHFLLAAFAGMWAGAASHTFTDMAGTYIKTGRVADFL